MRKAQPAGEPKTWRERAQALRHLPPLLAEVWQTKPIYAFSSLLCRALSAFLPVAILYVSKLLVDEVVGLATNQPGVSTTHLWRLLALELALVLASDLLSRLMGLCDSLLADLFTNHITLRLMRHAASLDLVTFEDPAFQDKLERARRQTTDRLSMLFLVASLGQQALSLLAMSASVIAFSPLFFACLVISLVPVFWSESHFAAMAYSLLYRWTPERRQIDYLRLLGASHTTAKEVKIFGLSGYLIDRVDELFQRFYAENRQLAVRRATVNYLWGLLPSGAYYASYVYILQQTIARAISVGDLIFLTRAFSNCRSLLSQIFQNLSRVAEQALYVRDLFEFFDTKPALPVSPHALPAPRPIRDGFVFDKVEFAYPGATKNVLNGISFHLAPGEKIALLGENGAGKTTLVKLLCRLYDPTGGCILLDGVDLREYDPESLRREIGVIFQDFLKYDAIARDNIGFGAIDAMGDVPAIGRASEKSYADSVISTLASGYDTMLGRRFEGGVELSQGQWQKIALARAYMRDAQLLILDEPTASLDARAEYEVFERFANLTAGKSAVLISHRFSTVRMADQILVLENGRILEQGTHSGLLALGNRYAELFELQAAGYR
ncbi:ABC transporter ATP-binding protein [Bryobacter aggregatus]|uniref:ABC transporter ATP-binding protein n=1 Tax=Bryobacter aggregatus TaxID=360054 RepID=UPI0004E13E7A|nr:ABC transporter ATP-binding protein [Bryobacter aggregatus]